LSPHLIARWGLFYAYSDTMLILGDILVTEDFSKVGISIGKDAVFCLNDGTTTVPSAFKYYSKAFQTKTLEQVW